MPNPVWISLTFKYNLDYKYSDSVNNKALNKSKHTTDNDEFYTYYKDIALEVDNYASQLKGKHVYCNCDNPYLSQFVLYFIRNFKKIGLKSLTSTCLNNPHGLYFHVTDIPQSIIDGNSLDIMMWTKKHTVELNGNGGFQTPECQQILKTCDVVITNPPFSLFRDWYDLVKSAGKKYLVVANMNTCLSANISADIVEGKARFGCATTNRVYYFWRSSPNSNDRLKIGYICWLTNMKTVVKPFIPTVKRSISDYTTYDGTMIIKVPKLAQIPAGYKGVMGVPITFLFKHNPAQFKIVGFASHGKDNKYDMFSPHINGKEQYKAILIKYA